MKRILPLTALFSACLLYIPAASSEPAPVCRFVEHTMTYDLIEYTYATFETSGSAPETAGRDCAQDLELQALATEQARSALQEDPLLSRKAGNMQASAITACTAYAQAGSHEELVTLHVAINPEKSFHPSTIGVLVKTGSKISPLYSCSAYPDYQYCRVEAVCDLNGDQVLDIVLDKGHASGGDEYIGCSGSGCERHFGGHFH